MGTQPQSMSRWPLSGREGELETFTTVWADRRCQGVVIHGPAGVGKSRLAEECLARAVRQGWKGRRATASAAAAAVPLGAIAHLIPPGVDLSNPLEGFAAVATELAGPQRDRLAIWVDDLHLLDAASAVLLRQLIDARVVRLIATVRTGEPIGEAVEALTRPDGMHRIDLTAFDPQQAQTALETALGGPVGRGTLHELYTASGGNALYLHELVLGALASGALASDGSIWELTGDRPVGTPRLTELVQARLADAGSTARPVLELLALAGPVSLADTQQAASLDLLTDLEQAGLIRVATSRRRTTVHLAHPLYGEVLRESIPALRRRAVLLQQADRTQAHSARRRDDALHVAAWQLAATGTADPALLVRAAALARHAHDYQQTVALLQALPHEMRTTMTRLLLGSALQELGRPEQAEATLAEADAHAMGETEKLIAVFARALTLASSRAKTAEALGVIQSAMNAVTSPGGREQLQVLEGSMLVEGGQPIQGLERLKALKTDVQEVSDVNIWLLGAFTTAMGLAVCGRTAEAEAWAERTYSQHLAVAERAIIPHPAALQSAMVLARSEAGQLGRARLVGENAYAALTEVGAPVAQAWLGFFLAWTEWLAGHPTAAHRWCAEAAAIARSHQIMSPLPLVLAMSAATAVLQDDTAMAEAALAEQADYPFIGYFAGAERIGEAWLLATRGQLAKARDVLGQAARSARESGHTNVEALLLTDIARLGGATEVQDRLAELAEQSDGAWAPARARLVAALAAEDPDQLLAVSSELEEIGADLLAAEAATQAATLWKRAGQTRRSAAAAQQAQSCADRCQGANTPLLISAEPAASLTAREREVALLAAAGTSSKEIAQILHLSVRTIDNHLQHAYSKLGVTTRRELARTLGTTSARPPNAAGSAR
ncbi:LuxR C-terminal-related transcriptional regulator [Streptomyces wedmorensis]